MVGRPPLSPEVKRRFCVSVKLNEAEFTWLRAVAHELGTPYLSRVLRYIINYLMPSNPEEISPKLRDARARMKAGIYGKTKKA
jgi:hypothetical protein